MELTCVRVAETDLPQSVELAGICIAVLTMRLIVASAVFSQDAVWGVLKMLERPRVGRRAKRSLTTSVKQDCVKSRVQLGLRS